MEGLGLAKTNNIGVGILAGEGETTLKYSLGHDKAVTKTTIRQFAQRFAENEEKEYVLAEPLPTAEEAAAIAPVVKVVGSTFDELIHDESMDVFVMVTNDRCKHCEAFMPTWRVRIHLKNDNFYTTNDEFHTNNDDFNADMEGIGRHIRRQCPCCYCRSVEE